MNPLDPASIEGKTPRAAAHVSLIVVGAGPAGLVAATVAAKRGIETMLIDEHPVSTSLMGLDVPQHFGQRMTAAMPKSRLMEQVVETNPGIAEAYELGVDVQLGVCVWAIFANGPALSSGSRPLVGLADDSHSWFVSCDRVIVASGARDVCIGFPGWEKPGVMGVQAGMLLMQRYDAFTGARLLVLGAGELGLQVAEAALKKGLGVAGIVDIEAEASSADSARIASLGVPLYFSHGIQEARGALEVESAVLIRLDGDQRPIAGTQTTVNCDTIVLAIDAVPNIELLDALGCQMEFSARRGGWVPQLDGAGTTSVSSVHAVGDCADLSGDAVRDGTRVGSAVAAALAGQSIDRPADAPSHALHGQHVTGDRTQRAGQWLRAQVDISGLDVMVCQCEEVTRREIVELQPPRYVPQSPNTACSRNLEALKSDGPLNQDQVKRLTRAGMGPCQGRRCREQVQCLLEAAAACDPGGIPLARYRPPVRPLPMAVLAASEESAALAEHWVAWFNISTQWLTHWEILPAPLPSRGQAPSIVPGE
jgi:thioredoxin reductase